VETTGSVDLAIGGSLDTVVVKLTQLTLGEGGFVAKSQLQLGSAADVGASYGSLVLQVPQASFSDLLNHVEQVGKVTSESSTSTDVTGQYVDLQARIAALEATRQQFLQILAKAEAIGDILSVEEQINDLQVQIEQLQGQQRVLDDQTTYSTLSVQLSEQGATAAPHPEGLSAAWDHARHSFSTGLESVVSWTGGFAVFLLCLAALGLLARLGWSVVGRRLV